MRALLVLAAALWAAPALAQLREVPATAPPAPRPAPAAPSAPAPAPPTNNAPVPGEEALYMGGFNGTWVGKLTTIDPAAYDDKIGSGTPGQAGEFAIVVSGTSAKVYIRRQDAWSEVKPGAFRVAAHKTTAVIYAIDSASDVFDKTGSGGWVETWNFTLTHKTTTVLYVARWRAVNNYLKKPSEDSARFFTASFGELQQKPSLPD